MVIKQSCLVCLAETTVFQSHIIHGAINHRVCDEDRLSTSCKSFSLSDADAAEVDTAVTDDDDDANNASVSHNMMIYINTCSKIDC